MTKRKSHGDLQTNNACIEKRPRRKKKVYENPWKAAKGESEIKYVDVSQEKEEPVMPTPLNIESQGLCSTSPTRLLGNKNSKIVTTSVSKLEFVNPSSQYSMCLEEETDIVKRKSSPNETLVSLDSKSGTEDKSSNTPNMSTNSEVWAAKSQNTPTEGLNTSTLSTYLKEYDPDREHTRDSPLDNKFAWVTRRKQEEIQLTTSSDLRQFMCPVGVGSSIKKTPSQGNGAYLQRVISSSLVTQESTPVDQQFTKTSIKDINEKLMADRLMQAEKRVKHKQKSFFTPTCRMPVGGRILLPEPPVNCFLESDEVEKSKSTSKKRPENKLTPGYGSSELLMDYKMLRKIGSGEFGTVHTVVSRYDGCVYAVKKSNKLSISLKLRAREMLCMSAIWSKGSCENLVRYYRGWTEDNIVYSVMEFCERGNLKALRSDSSTFNFSQTIIRKIFKHTASGLAHMHSINLVHMDVKPENILVSNDWKFKLCDFGHCTKLSKENGRPIYPIRDGDKRYISNEVLKEDYSDLFKSDIFSLGASLYELARGKALPLEGKEWVDLRKGKYDLIKGYSHNLNNLLLSCMAIRPAGRPSAKIVYKALTEAAVEQEKQSHTNEEFEALESSLKSITNEKEKLKIEISKLKEKNKLSEDKFNLLLQRKQSTRKEQFYRCKSFNQR